MWFVTPEMLEGTPPGVFPGAHDELHFAVSAEPPSGERVSRWLDELPGRIPYAEQDTDILRHRWFTRPPTGG